VDSYEMAWPASSRQHGQKRAPKSGLPGAAELAWTCYVLKDLEPKLRSGALATFPIARLHRNAFLDRSTHFFSVVQHFELRADDSLTLRSPALSRCFVTELQLSEGVLTARYNLDKLEEFSVPQVPNLLSLLVLTARWSRTTVRLGDHRAAETWETYTHAVI